MSTYATFYKRAQKPFNSLLHETYECVRDDKGFRFLAEKVARVVLEPPRRNATQRNATQCNATQRNAAQRNAARRCATQRNAAQRNALQRNAVQCSVGGEEPTAY